MKKNSHKIETIIMIRLMCLSLINGAARTKAIVHIKNNKETRLDPTKSGTPNCRLQTPLRATPHHNPTPKIFTSNKPSAV